MTTVEDIAGAWKDAFPEGINSVEIVRCNRNGWDYDDYIRLRDMGVEPDDIAGIADLLNASTEREREMRQDIKRLAKEADRLRERERALQEEMERLRGKCNRLAAIATLEWGDYYNIALHKERMYEEKARRYANSATGLEPGDLMPEPCDAAQGSERGLARIRRGDRAR